jgi:ABC-type amino acid transport substrate-binding protein
LFSRWELAPGEAQALRIYALKGGRQFSIVARIPYSTRSCGPMVLRCLALLIACLSIGLSASAQPAPDPTAPEKKQLTFGTRQVPPFAFKNGDGNWGGITIDLARDVAKRLNYELTIVDLGDVKQLVAGIAEAQVALGGAALTVTEEREQILDFSHPFFSTGLAIAAQPAGTSPVWNALRSFFTWESLMIVVAIIGGVVLIGVFLKWLEGLRGNQDFDSVGEGIWGSLTMFLTSQFTNPEPKSLAGRALAVFWVVMSIGAMTFLTGVVTTALTVQSLEGRVRGIADLPQVRTGAVANSTGGQFLKAERIPFRAYDDVEAGLRAVAAGDLDAFVHDAPIMQYIAKEKLQGAVVVLPGTFEQQDYALAFPEGSPLREPVNRELIAIKRSEAWKELVYTYLGER